MANQQLAQVRNDRALCVSINGQEAIQPWQFVDCAGVVHIPEEMQILWLRRALAKANRAGSPVKRAWRKRAVMSLLNQVRAGRPEAVAMLAQGVGRVWP